jgi:hypothetical protein
MGPDELIDGIGCSAAADTSTAIPLTNIVKVQVTLPQAFSRDVRRRIM